MDIATTKKAADGVTTARKNQIEYAYANDGRTGLGARPGWQSF